MSHSIPEQLRFSPAAGFTIRANFNGGGLSSDIGPLLLRAGDRQIGLTARITGALNDARHPGYIKHSLSGLLQQRIYQIGSGYEDGNDSNSLRNDLHASVGRRPQAV